ncbi:hypothetical protein AUC68_05615 [Methyloceanibacter methanicus]|uniref:MFS transporter permease n=1 Tax=Methyloceanibacter methanicus TaxID=1774968 RepID=A0A1E3W0V7_9HYPH|nr:DUF6064 family protein [Methyloceanibacter methanicus]ODR99444.1 hypothetical protein AUC68_05615 [Methyloceanibacter methanicus]
MTEWWTYEPRDLLMFSPDVYYRLFELHNAAVWPAQILALAGGLVGLVLIARRASWAGRVAAGVLAVGWAVVAVAYFHARYASINLAAPWYGWAFTAQAILLALSGVALGRLAFTADRTWPQNVGVALLVFALLLQPLIGLPAGRPWTGVELAGLAPDPTVLATLGVVLAADRVRWELLPIPLLWCAVTGATLWTMGSPEALLMPAAGAATLLLGIWRSHRDWRDSRGAKC